MKPKMKTAIPADEVEEANAEEIADAAEESLTEVTAPELDERTKKLTEWDDAPEAHGSAVPKVLPDEEDDEDTVATKLVYEGTDEADRDRRLAAEDPDFEP
jgi:hypothetical protein